MGKQDEIDVDKGPWHIYIAEVPYADKGNVWVSFESKPDLSLLSFFIAGHEGFTFDERQELLEMSSPAARIEREVELLDKKIDMLHAREEIRKITGGNGKMRKV